MYSCVVLCEFIYVYTFISCGSFACIVTALCDGTLLLEKILFADILPEYWWWGSNDFENFPYMYTKQNYESLIRLEFRVGWISNKSNWNRAKNFQICSHKKRNLHIFLILMQIPRPFKLYIIETISNFINFVRITCNFFFIYFWLKKSVILCCRLP